MPGLESADPGASTGHGHGRRVGARAGAHCHITAKVAPARLTAGEKTVLAGTIACPEPEEAAGKTVTVMEHVAGVPGSSVAGTTTSEADGSYRFSSEPLESDTSFYASIAGAHSARHTAKVGAHISISGPAEGAQLLTSRDLGGGRRTSTVTFSGRVTPVATGAHVALEREFSSGDEAWCTIGRGLVGSNGTYSIAHTFVAPGSESVRVVVGARGMQASASQALSFEVSQRQNPRLTIETAADPVSYGQPVTISGKAAGDADGAVTLLARIHGGGFQPVAKTSTDAAGDYVFPPQSPQQSTIYKVRSARAGSSELVEGVKPVLTAQVSQASIQEGQPLTFSGTIAPDRSGHVFYLEREGILGIGFRVVAAGTFAAGSTFSLEYAPSGTGSQVFRIDVPGNSENQGVVSAPITVQMTPAPAAELVPPEPSAATPEPSTGMPEPSTTGTASAGEP